MSEDNKTLDIEIGALEKRIEALEEEVSVYQARCDLLSSLWWFVVYLAHQLAHEKQKAAGFGG